METVSIFGPKRSWYSVYVYTLKRLKTVFPWIDAARREDAAGEAIEFCLTKWVHYPSSIVEGNPDLTFRGACLFASRRATTTIATYLKDQRDEERWQLEKHDPLLDRAGEVIDRLRADERDWVGWAKAFLAGVSGRKAAEEAGVSHSTMHRRRREGLRKVREEL